MAKIDTDRAQVRQRIADTLQAAAAQLQGTGLVEDLARLFREDPHQAELDLRDAVAGLARGLWGQAFAARDDHGDQLQIDGKSPRQVAASSGQATTLFGTVTFPRVRTHPSGAGWGGSVATDLWGGSRNEPSDPPDGRGGAGV